MEGRDEAWSSTEIGTRKKEERKKERQMDDQGWSRTIPRNGVKLVRHTMTGGFGAQRADSSTLPYSRIGVIVEAPIGC